jgi:hypothetical protein
MYSDLGEDVLTFVKFCMVGRFRKPIRQSGFNLPRVSCIMLPVQLAARFTISETVQICGLDSSGHLLKRVEIHYWYSRLKLLMGLLKTGR